MKSKKDSDGNDVFYFDEEDIRLRAYSIWRAWGSPDGNERHPWTGTTSEKAAWYCAEASLEEELKVMRYLNHRKAKK